MFRLTTAPPNITFEPLGWPLVWRVTLPPGC